MAEKLDQLLAELSYIGSEADYVRFSRNFSGVNEEALHACELAALAMRAGAEAGWRIWGVSKKRRKLTGTDFDPNKPYKRGLSYATWMALTVGEGFSLEFHQGKIGNKRVVVMSAALAGERAKPTASTPALPAEPIRTASFPSESELPVQAPARKLASHESTSVDGTSAKRRSGLNWLDTATDDLDASYALNLLDWETPLRARSMPIPDQTSGVIDVLQRMGFLVIHGNGNRVSITNLGALAAARDLRMFDNLDRLAIQVVSFRGTGRAEATAIRRFDTGYAVAVDEACAWVQSFFADRDGTWDASAAPYPMAALREVVTNAVSHQDLNAVSSSVYTEPLGSDLLNPPSFVGPLIEVFSNRIEVSNSGTLSVPLPHIANESLRAEGNPMAQTLRSFRARPTPRSGWSSILESCDLHRTPVPLLTGSAASELSSLEFARRPDISANQMSLGELLAPENPADVPGAMRRAWAFPEDSTASNASSAQEPDNGTERVSVTLQPAATFKNLSQEQRLIATYWHAFNRLAHDDYLTNGSLRERFNVEDSNSAQISRLIKDAALHGLIRVTDPNAAPKFKRYIPYWA